MDVFSLPESEATLEGLVLEAGPAGLQLLQTFTHAGSGPRLLPPQSHAHLPTPGHLL